MNTRSSRTLRSAPQLRQAGLLPPDAVAAAEKVAERYAVAVTPAVAALIESPDDPIGRQYLPSAAELVDDPSDRPDPIGDEALSPVKGIVHRYPDRVLLKPLLVCPVYCRFCFRREQVGDADGTLTPAELDAALAYIAAHPELREVILTGGDPLMLPPGRLAGLLARVAAIPQVETIRIHSRIPVADPGRVTAGLVEAMRLDKPVWLAVHVNHARELSPESCRALKLLADGGLPLLSQTVLLKGVNDDPAVLEELFRALLRNRVKPYYLHHPDLAPGTAHFRPSLAEGRAIVKALRGRLSGIAQPTYVLDIPGGAGKVPVGPDAWDEGSDMVEDWRGQGHRYG